MSSPKHLWSGDWRQDSAAVSEELARQRAQAPERDEPPAPPPPKGPSAYARALALLRRARSSVAAVLGRRPPRAALLATLVVLLAAGGAYGLTTLVESGGSASATANGPIPWLGLQLESVPINRVLVSAVVPGSPAERAGLGPGDVVTQIDNRPVTEPGDVNAAIAGLHVGDKVEIQINRGLQTYTTRATLAARPAGYP